MTGAPIDVSNAGFTTRSGGSSTDNRCMIDAGRACSLARGISNQTTPTIDGANCTAGVPGSVASDIAASKASPLRRTTVAPESASSTSTDVTVTGTEIALVSINS